MFSKPLNGTKDIRHGTTDARTEARAEARPLNIIIVGAGIGGLSAAIFLRQNGHHVTLLEQSRFANELGAAVHVAPNATGLLLRMGINPEDLGAVPCRILSQSKPNMELMFEIPVWRSARRWQHEWFLAHRVDLHSELKKRATMDEGLGTPAVLRTSSRVASVGTDGTVDLESGERLMGDAVIGADGVYSKARYSLSGSQCIKPFGSGKSAFRFTILRSRALEDPLTKPIVAKEGHLNMFFGKDRRVVVYPTRNQEILNFVCIHPTSEAQVKDEVANDWQDIGNLDKMLAVYKDWHPAILKLLSMADKDTLKVWELLDMHQLPTWTEGQLALIGDAAHPFTPHQGQGAGQAIEDAASLACVLPSGTPLHEVPERLKLYQQCRFERASMIQEYSRLAGKDFGDGPPLNTSRYTADNFGHDEWHHTSQKLRQWQWNHKPTTYKRMPISFGPSPGPRQDHLGNARDWSNSTFSTASIKFRTSRTLLQNLLPTPAFEFASVDTNCFATFSLTSLGNLEWLGGHGYNHFGLYIHNIKYTRKNGETVLGTYLPVLFENLADPIVSGREELGFPKVYSSLDTVREVDTWSLKAGWMGNNFLNLSLGGLRVKSSADILHEPHPPSIETLRTLCTGQEEGLFFYKYIPKTGTLGNQDQGQADVEYSGFLPNEQETKAPRRLERILVAERAEIRFDALDSKKLPTLHHIVARLAEIPIYEIVEAEIIEGKGYSDVRGAQKLF
ncbi:hypothetical protein N0V90_013097 [Kalmusia sp. IMI 367209]|nr:hypothetical protein N0V90_013097 [Kalmusia sp. IMI 367209]